VSERVLLHAALVVPSAGAEPIADAGILIEDGVIAAVGSFSAVRQTYPLARERDKTGLVALPGFVDGHSHGRAIPLGEQGVREGPLELFLAQLPALTPLDPYLDAYVAGSDLLATGIVAVQVFFHSFAPAERYIEDARAVVAGLAASGIDFELVLGFTDQDEYLPAWVADAPAGAEDLLEPARGLDAEEFLEVFDTLAAAPDVSVTIGPVATQWCSERVLEGVAERVRSGARAHTHLLESRAQRTQLDPSPVEILRRHGLLGPQLSAAHAVWLSEAEIAEVAAVGTALVHCPGSNARLAGRSAPVRSWLDAGVAAGLGLDSYPRAEPPDVFDEMRAAREAASGALEARQALALATTGSASALGRPGLGVLEPGSPASLVLVATSEGACDPLEELLAKVTRHDVAEVWSRGVLCVQDGHLLGRRNVELSRAQLRRELAADAAGRLKRLAEVALLEPWLADVWSLEPADAGARSERG
jgi:5-methylthioadenosine/S-adenosylhomocysteine deaminase